MVINLKEKLLDKIGGIEFIEPNKDESWYNKGVRETKARIVTFFNENLIPEVPQYVADWYESNKKNLDYNLWNYVYDWEDQEDSKFQNWFNNSKEAFQTIINMHQFGYKIKKEKKYTVKLTKTQQYLYYVDNDFTFVTYVRPDDNPRLYHTRKELEEAGLEEVFSSLLFEVEEMME